MKLIQNTLFFLLGIMLFSCNGGTENNTTVVTDSTSTTTQTQATPVKAELTFNYLGQTDYEAPQNEIILKIDGKEHRIDTILACDVISKESYKDSQIPAEAISACGGWWAGGGDYFYLMMENNQPVVYQGWQDEGQEDVGYHWTKMNLNLK